MDKILGHIDFLITQNCNYRCFYCSQSKKFVTGNFEEANDDTINGFLNFLEKIEKPYEITISGGEPLVQDTLGAAMDEVKALGYQIGLHTGGYRPAHLKEVLSKTDWVGFDIKAPLEAERYKDVTGGIADVEKVRESLHLLINSGVPFECRTTCDPRFLSVKDIYTIADTLKGLGVKEYYLQKYRKVPSDTDTTESQCLALVEDTALLAYLQGCFDVFDVRK